MLKGSWLLDSANLSALIQSQPLNAQSARREMWMKGETWRHLVRKSSPISEKWIQAIKCTQCRDPSIPNRAPMNRYGWHGSYFHVKSTDVSNLSMRIMRDTVWLCHRLVWDHGSFCLFMLLLWLTGSSEKVRRNGEQMKAPLLQVKRCFIRQFELCIEHNSERLRLSSFWTFPCRNMTRVYPACYL